LDKSPPAPAYAGFAPDRPGTGIALEEDIVDKGLRTLDGLRVLVVEDDDDTREVLTLGLSLYGANVVSVTSAAEAMVEMEKNTPDVIVSDIGLPDEDGLALIRRVRKLPPSRGGRVPAVAVTAFTLGDDGEEATRAGFQRYFRKPVETRDLFGAVAALGESGRVERRRRARRSPPPPRDKRPGSTDERRADAERRTIVLA
jgi:CheY-like chemotaxis protein